MLRQVSSSRWIGRAPAKVNLYLRVVSRRPDGYHEIETVMVKLRDLADSLVFERVASPDIELTVQLAYPGALQAPPVPVDAQNLVVRAARLLQEATGTTSGARIHLVKRIPAAAGLGGGSSDAATTLAALNQLWETRLPPERLLPLAASLGSDVPFFLANSACTLCTGRGEQLSPLRTWGRLHLVLAKPRSGLSTPAVYRACHPEPEVSSAYELRVDLQALGVRGVAHRLHNSLQAPGEMLNPEVSALRRLFERQGVLAHQMTGSGSAYFAICASHRQACCIARRLLSAGVPWVCTSTTSA